MCTLEQNVLDEFSTYLKKDKFKNKIKELTLLYRIDEDGTFIFIEQFLIKKSQVNKGYGSTILSHIVQFADKYNVRIRLYAKGLDLKRLYEFFSKQGFFLINKAEGEMLYYPKKNLKK